MPEWRQNIFWRNNWFDKNFFFIFSFFPFCFFRFGIRCWISHLLHTWYYIWNGIIKYIFPRSPSQSLHSYKLACSFFIISIDNNNGIFKTGRWGCCTYSIITIGFVQWALKLKKTVNTIWTFLWFWIVFQDF